VELGSVRGNASCSVASTRKVGVASARSADEVPLLLDELQMLQTELTAMVGRAQSMLQSLRDLVVAPAANAVPQRSSSAALFQLSEYAALRNNSPGATTGSASDSSWDYMLCVPPVTIDLLKRSVTVLGVPRTLRPREFDVLAYLMKNQGRIVSHRELLEQVWRTSHDVRTSAVRNQVSALRRVLGPADHFIRNGPCGGWGIAI
jgi:DNA-binding response OmpR family regulator